MKIPFINRGSKLYVSTAAPMTKTLSGYAAVTYTQVRGVQSIGDAQESYQMVDNRPIGKRPYRMRVGTEAVSLEVQLYKVPDDGQSIMNVAVADYRTYTYKVEQPDGTLLYFTAQASSRSRGISTELADSRITLELMSDILEA